MATQSKTKSFVERVICGRASGWTVVLWVKKADLCEFRLNYFIQWDFLI